MTKNSHSDELLDKVLRPGSSFYYSTLHLDPQQRTLHAVLFALFQEWMSLYNNSREPQVANTALHWWLQQVEHFSKCTAHKERPHPLLDRLAPLYKTAKAKILVAERMQKILVTLIQYPHEHASPESLENFLKHTWGNLCVMTSLSPDSVDKQIENGLENTVKNIKGSPKNIEDNKLNLAIQQQAGLLIGYYNLFKNLAGQLKAQRSPLPLSWLNTWKINPAQLIAALQTQHKPLQTQYESSNDVPQTISGKAIKKLLLHKIGSLLEQEQITLESLLNQQTHYDLNCLVPLKVIRFESALLRLTIKQDFQIFDYRLQISPLKKFWLAWRCKRHYKMHRVRKIISNA